MLDLKALLAKMLNAIKVDYVVEIGTNNSWTYRKWNSGYCEAVRKSQGTFNMDKLYVSPIYYMNTYYTIPSGLFTEVEYANIQRLNGGYGLITFSVREVDLANSQMWFYAFNSGQSYSATFTVGMILKGRWK